MVLSLVELCFLVIIEKMEYNNEKLQRIPLNLIEKLINFMVSRLHPNHMALQSISKPVKIKLVRQNRIITMRFSIYSNTDKIIHQIYERVLNEEKMEYLTKKRSRLASTNSSGGPTATRSNSSNNFYASPPNNNNNSSNSGSISQIMISDEEEEKRRRDEEDLADFQSSWGAIENYGLFQLSGSFRNSRWLKLDKTLAFYEIDSNEILEFKSTKTVLKIKFFGPWERVVHPLHQSTMFDETIKTFSIDESKTVAEISQDLALKLLLRNPEELSLKRIIDETDSLGTWLSSDLTLPEQNIDPIYTVFMLKRQFFFSRDTIVDFSMDPEMSHFVFCQCLDAIIDGSHPCTQHEAVLFAALQCQIYFGDYNAQSTDNTVQRGFDFKDVLPAECSMSKNVVKEVQVQYQKLSGMTEQKAKLNFIQLAKSLKTYGYSFFKVVQVGKGARLFGISSEAVLILDPETKGTLHLYSLGNVKKWQVLNNLFSIDFNDRKESFTSSEAESISHVLSSYIHYHLRNQPEVQKAWDMNYLNVGRMSSSRRLSASSTDSNDSLSNYDKYWKNQYGLIIKKCPLYVEPKKLYFNPLYNPLGNGALGQATKDYTNKDTKVTKLLKVLTDLSSKMIQSFSPTKSFPSREREIVVKFSDKKVKSFIVDESKTVAEITIEIGTKLGIKNTEEFSLQVLYNLNESNSNTSLLNNSNSNLNFVNNNNSNSYIINSSSLYNNNNNNNNNNGSNNLSILSQISPSTSPNSSFIIPSTSSNSNSNSWNSASGSDEFMYSSGGIWLKPYKSLISQNIPLESKLLFKKKFYTSDTAGTDDCNNDPVYFNLLFFQSKDAIISNTYTCSKEEAIQLAATLFQINFGDHNPNIHKPGFLKSQDLKFFLPPNSLELWGVSFQKIEKSIYKEHQNLRGIKEVYAKYRYVQLCRSLKTFGAIFFSVRLLPRDDGFGQTITSNSSFVSLSQGSSGSGGGSNGFNGNDSDESAYALPINTSLLIGFSRKCILFMTAKSKKFLVEYPLTQLKRWAHHKQLSQLTLDFGCYDQGRLTFQSLEAEEIAMYLSDYVDHIQTKLVGSHSFSSSILGS